MSRPESDVPESANTSWWSLLLDPAGLIVRRLEGVGTAAAMVVSTLAFTTISLQAALDLARTRGDEWDALAALVLRGALLGSVGVAGLAMLAWLLTRPFGTPGPGHALRAIGGAYGSALIYGIVGLGLNLLLGWNTAVACGVSGLLWALGPLFLALRELAGGRSGVAALLATLGGAAMLGGWVWWGVGA